MFLLTLGPDGFLYDWQAGICITSQGSEAIDPALNEIGDCPVCLQRACELRMGVCIECFLEGPDHE